ncbi:MAG TPA: ribonuclease P protein component [bacterium]|jgi:ribonuclease P protein component|nr:ribonuclease P protein component [Myxococcales bacterium]HPW45728.1 ribonuclease P protein component [bacterium]HQC50327.1 ribonuclease P protein component [bacterium]
MTSDDRKKFSPKERIRRGDDFKKVRCSGVRSRGRFVTLSFLPGNLKKLGLIATKKSGDAVSRNRLKRVARDFFRLNKKDFPSGETVVIFGTDSGEIDNMDIRDDLWAALERLVARIS